MKHLLRLIVPLALVAAPLAAQDAHFGVQAGANLPMTDLKDFVGSKAGITVGVNGTVDLGSGQVVRPRIDYSYYKASIADPIFSGNDDNKVKTLFLGADYMYFPAQRMEGFYVTAGLGYQNTKAETDNSNYTFSDSKGAFAWAAGAGWQFTENIGGEVRYVSSHPKFDNGTFKTDALNLAVTFKF